MHYKPKETSAHGVLGKLIKNVVLFKGSFIVLGVYSSHRSKWTRIRPCNNRSRGVKFPLLSWFPLFWKFLWGKILAFSFIFSLFLTFFSVFPRFYTKFLFFQKWSHTPLPKALTANGLWCPIVTLVLLFFNMYWPWCPKLLFSKWPWKWMPIKIFQGLMEIIKITCYLHEKVSPLLSKHSKSICVKSFSKSFSTSCSELGMTGISVHVCRSIK